MEQNFNPGLMLNGFQELRPGDYFANSHNINFCLDYLVILLGENWLWSLLGLKGLRQGVQKPLSDCPGQEEA